MKTTITRSLLTAATLLMTSGAFATDAWRPGQYMTQAIARIVEMGTALESKSDFGWNSNGVCLLGAFLHPGGDVRLEIWLQAGQQYAFVGGADESASDLDLEILSNGKRLAADTDADSTPIAAFRPETSGHYTLRLRLYSARVASFAAVAILNKGGYTVPVRNLTDAFDNNMRLARTANNSLNGVRYHEYENQWALFGQIVPQGGNMTLHKLSFEAGRGHVILATGDTNAQDLDLTLHRDGRLVGQDKDRDANPVVVFTTTGGDHSIAVSNERSSGAALVVATVLDRN